MAITQVFNDTFTDTDLTLLTAHTPEQGLGWSPIIGNGGTNARINGGTLVQPFYNPTASSYYTADTTESPTLAQEIEFTFSVAAGRTGRVCLRLRDGTTSANCILVEFSTALNNVRIFSVIEGATTLVAESLNAAGLLVDGVLCKAAVDASNTVTARIASTDITFNTSTIVSGHDVAGKFGWRGVKSYDTNGIDSFTGFYDAAGPTPISFDGNIANQTFTAGDSVNIDLSGNWSGTQTPFTFALTSGSLTGTGLTLSSTGVLSGTATEATQTGLVITGTDANTDTAVSNSFSVTINAAITTHNVSIADTLPAIESSVSMTYEAPAGAGTITISDWANNTGTPLPNLTGITVNVRSLVDGSLVYRTTTATTNAGSDCVVSDAAIVTGTEYEVSAIKFNGVDYDIGIAIITAT